MVDSATLSGIATSSIASRSGVDVASIASISGITFVSGGFTYNGVIDYSAMFDSTSTTFLSRTNSGTAVDAQIFTFSVWLKRTVLGTDQIIAGGKTDGDNKCYFGFNTSDQFEVHHKRNAVWQCDMVTNAVFRDCSQWYHIHYVYDSDQGTASDRIVLTINGVDYDAADSDLWATYDLPDGGEAARFIENGQTTHIGKYADAAEHFIGYLAMVYGIEGVAVPASEFGEFNGNVWIPKDYTVGSYSEGDMSFKLDFADSSNFGNDVSVNAADFTDNNFGTDHQVIDTPENNFCTLDYNAKRDAATVLLTEGGLRLNYTSSSWEGCASSWLLKSGKWYWELDIGDDTTYHCIGIVRMGENIGDIIASGNYDYGLYTGGFGITHGYNPVRVLVNQTVSNSGNLDAPAANNILMVAVDADANKIWFGTNGVWNDKNGVGDPANGSNADYTSADGLDCDLFDYVPVYTIYGLSAGTTDKVNFGQLTGLAQANFNYTPPTGFNSLCTENLPDPVLDDCGDAVDVVLYEGTGAELEISDLAFQPDFVWIKNRDATDSHQIFDSLRGATYPYDCNDGTGAEAQDADTLTSFDSDGFTVNVDVKVNTNTENYVAWCLKEGADYGFDIVTYEGTGVAQAINHNLGVVPKMIWVWNRSQGRSAPVYHYAGLNKTDPETDYGLMDVTNAWTDSNTMWDDTAPTSTQFTVGTEDNTNENGEDHVAYLFADAEGLTKVFHYEGNGNAAGPYVYCGFRPRIILYKNADDGSRDWRIYDTERNPINGENTLRCLPDDNAAEASEGAVIVDILSNGFKIKNSSAFVNGNNNTIIGVAFAEQPFKYANAR